MSEVYAINKSFEEKTAYFTENLRSINSEQHSVRLIFICRKVNGWCYFDFKLDLYKLDVIFQSLIKYQKDSLIFKKKSARVTIWVYISQMSSCVQWVNFKPRDILHNKVGSSSSIVFSLTVYWQLHFSQVRWKN